MSPCVFADYGPAPAVHGGQTETTWLRGLSSPSFTAFFITRACTQLTQPPGGRNLGLSLESMTQIVYI